MAVMNTGLSVAGLKSEFLNRFNATQTLFQDLSTRIVSTKDSETYKWLGTVPNMREWGTGRLAKGLRSESYSVENQKYEATIEVDRDEIADDQTGQIAIRINELAQRAALHKDYLLGQLLINGAVAGYNSYDGVTFFNDAHVSGKSGNQNNKLEYTAAAATKTTAECKGALQQAIAQLLTFKDDQGEPMNVSTNGIVVAVPSTMYFPMLEAVNASVIATTSNVLQGVAKVVPYPYLSDGTKFYVCKTDGIVRPFVFQDREPIEFTALDKTDDGDAFLREKFLYGVRARYRMTYGYWQYCVETTFTN